MVLMSPCTSHTHSLPSLVPIGSSRRVIIGPAKRPCEMLLQENWSLSRVFKSRSHGLSRKASSAARRQVRLKISAMMLLCINLNGNLTYQA